MGDIYADGGVSAYPTSLDTRTAQVDASPTITFSTSSASASKLNEVADAVIAVETAVGISTVYGPGYKVVGCDCINNTATPNTQYDLDADFILLRPVTYGTDNPISVLRMAPGAALTNNVALAGPDPNERDQAAAFSASSWIHFYWIWNGTTLATLSSATAPPTGPSMPTGYTHWAYAGAVRFNGSSVLVTTYIKGNTAFYQVQQAALSGGTATVETAVDISAFVPPNATSVIANVVTGVTTGANGTGNPGVRFRVFTGVNYSSLFGVKNAAADETRNDANIITPNVAQNLYYLNVEVGDGTDTTEATINILGYGLPNGG